MGSFGYALTLGAMSEMATALRRPAEARRYAELAAAAKADFHKAFYSPRFGAYGGDAGAVQSLTVPALVLDSPPAVLRQLCSGGEGCAAEAGMPRQPGRWDRHQGPLPSSPTTADARSRCNRVTPSLQSRHAFTAIVSRSRCNRVTPQVDGELDVQDDANGRRWDLAFGFKASYGEI